MPFKRNLTLGAKLTVAFAALFFVLAGVGIFNAYQMRAVSGAAVEIEGKWLPSINALAELKLMFTRARLIGARVIATADPVERAKVEERHQSFIRWVAEASDRYEHVIQAANERMIFEQFVAAWHDYVEFEASLLMASAGDKSAISEFNFTAQQRYAKTLDVLNRLTALNQQRITQAVTAGAKTYQRALWLTGSMTLFAAVLAVWAALWLRRTIVSWTPLAEQFGGLVKLGSGCRQAATFSIPVAL